MNQILYKGYTFGGVGEDVTNKQYDNVTIHNLITDQDETYSPVGGENAEIFNCYKGSNRNIASTPYTTIIGLGNKDFLKQDFPAGENFIGGCYNINLGQWNNILGRANFVQGSSNTVFGESNEVNGHALFISGTANKAIGTDDSVLMLHDSGIIGKLNELYGDSDGSFIVGYGNKINVRSSAGNRTHTFVSGNYNNTTSCSESLICGDHNNASDCEFSLIFGINNNFLNGDACFLGGRDNLIRTSGDNSIFMGYGSETNHIENSFIFGCNSKIYASNFSLIFGQTDTNGTINYSTIIGHNNTTKENNAYIKETGESIQRSFIFGVDNIISKIEDAIIIGNSNNIQNIYAQNENDHSYNLTIGFNNSSSNSKASITIGDNNLINSNIENGCIIGKNNIIRFGSNGSFLLGEGNISENGAISSIILGKNNININGAKLAVSIGNNLHNNFVNGTVLGHYNEYPRVNELVTGKLLVLGNGYMDNQNVVHRSNCLEINEDGSQEIILQDKTLNSTLGIGKIKIKQEKIIFESLKENSSQQIETVEFTFEDLKQIKQNSQLPNLDNNSYPTT